MALKTSNKNRKKIHEQKINQIELEHQQFTKVFTKYYVITFLVLFALFTIL